MTTQLSQQSLEAWNDFLSNQENYGHVERGQCGENIEDHVWMCLESSKEMVIRVRKDLPSRLEPISILEIGSSAGLNCYALQSAYPNAKVVGVEPEEEAIKVACSMKPENGKYPDFVLGVGEDLPFDNGFFNLIICHTVIEHVHDVPKVIQELSRVLSDEGVIHLDAPNYIWPYEPHLKIYTVPYFGKRFVKWTAILQGKRRMVKFLNHLQFVTPRQLENLFQLNNLVWENRAKTKLLNAAKGAADIKKYKFAARVLSFLRIFGVSDFVSTVLIKMGLYPSVMYTLSKDSQKTIIDGRRP